MPEPSAGGSVLGDEQAPENKEQVTEFDCSPNSANVCTRTPGAQTNA
jgi:hypothetical protein